MNTVCIPLFARYRTIPALSYIGGRMEFMGSLVHRRFLRKYVIFLNVNKYTSLMRCCIAFSIFRKDARCIACMMHM